MPSSERTCFGGRYIGHFGVALHHLLKRRRDHPQPVENIGALHVALHGVAHRYVTPPLLGGVTVQRCNGKAKGLERAGAILARLATENPSRWAWLLPPGGPKDFSAEAGGG